MCWRNTHLPPTVRTSLRLGSMLRSVSLHRAKQGQQRKHKIRVSQILKTGIYCTKFERQIFKLFSPNMIMWYNLAFLLTQHKFTPAHLNGASKTASTLTCTQVTRFVRENRFLMKSTYTCCRRVIWFLLYNWVILEACIKGRELWETQTGSLSEMHNDNWLI